MTTWASFSTTSAPASNICLREIGVRAMDSMPAIGRITTSHRQLNRGLIKSVIEARSCSAIFLRGGGPIAGTKFGGKFGGDYVLRRNDSTSVGRESNGKFDVVERLVFRRRRGKTGAKASTANKSNETDGEKLESSVGVVDRVGNVLADVADDRSAISSHVLAPNGERQGPDVASGYVSRTVNLAATGEVIEARRGSDRRGTKKKKKKEVWIWTDNKDVETAAIESGWTTFILPPMSGKGAEREAAAAGARQVSKLARVTRLQVDGERIVDVESGSEIGLWRRVESGQDVRQLVDLVQTVDLVVMDAKDWQIIPAENVIAAFQGTDTCVFATAESAATARIMFESLEMGTDGVVLKTDDVSDVFALRAYLTSRQESDEAQGCRVSLTIARVVRILPVGMGDRVCVDLCSLLHPGEGMLVGSFARALFLVQSECGESEYIASRPFRVNAGPVHAYAAGMEGQTVYLSELQSGSEVLIVNARDGRTRSAIVGRVKIESRPLILIEVETESESGSGSGSGSGSERGVRHSTLLQNAETVRLVSPGPDDDGSDNIWLGGCRVKIVSVSDLCVGDEVLISLQHGARHAGMSIEEKIVEK